MSRTVPAQPRSSSRKARKGIIAGIAGIALLAGGGASFATWSDTYTTAASITAGTLDLRPGSQRPVWKVNDEVIDDLASFRLVPGSAVTYTEQIVLEAKGSGIKARLTPELGNFAKAEGVKYTVRVTEPGRNDNEGIRLTWDSSSGVTPKKATIAAGEPRTLDISVTIHFDKSKAQNDSQGRALGFDSVGITVTQV